MHSSKMTSAQTTCIAHTTAADVRAANETGHTKQCKYMAMSPSAQANRLVRCSACYKSHAQTYLLNMTSRKLLQCSLALQAHDNTKIHRTHELK
eukprot:14714-Heterococcus_DN1.PRE.2